MQSDELFSTKWSPSPHGFFDFVKEYRKITNCKMGGSRSSRYSYPHPTISKVLSVGVDDDRRNLPQRLCLSNFKIGLPITSYGCICRYVPNESQDDQQKVDTKQKKGEYLLIRRNDSLSYIDLINGNYRESQLYFMLQELPNFERKRLLKYDFDSLWYDLYRREPDGDIYEHAKQSFAKISPNLETILDLVPSQDPDGIGLWLFPKGRPAYINLNVDDMRLSAESPFDCALREFTEETNGLNINEEDLLFSDPIIERYLGSNSKNYQTTYFVFSLSSKSDLTQFDRVNTSIRDVSIGEVDQIKWVPYDELNKYLLPARMEMIDWIEENMRVASGYVNQVWKYTNDAAETNEYALDD